MTETTHTRSRRASLGGLLLQLVAFGATLALAYITNSFATYGVAWYLLGGVPIWLVALLVFRQAELAALEALDLEELRREKQASGGGEAMFAEEGGAGLGLRVAEARLRWMQRWLIPTFGLADAIYLATMGIVLWHRLTGWKPAGAAESFALTIGGPGWPELVRVPIAMILLAIVMLLTFLYSRYSSGMARVVEWQLLRGCGSYLLGNALALMILLVCLGVYQYAAVGTWEQTLAYVIPAVMIVLAVETLINFVLDIYRPRTPGVEARACFDSRLLGLLAEPGGIASSIADAINYQFGFQVSQTWFYQLLQRTFLPLMGAGAVAIWLLTCIVVVQPYEHVIIQRFGRQLNARQPLPPGLHFKLPWPIEVACTYNTGQLRQINVGFTKYNSLPDYEQARRTVQLWTDEKHLGQEHFDFLTCPPERKPIEEEAPGVAPAPDLRYGPAPDSPVNLVRLEAAVQYRIAPDKLDVYSSAMVDGDPDRALRDIAWEEISRFIASSTVESLLSQELSTVGRLLRDRISARGQELGLEVVYVGVTNVHPEKTVAEAFRNVVKAEQEKVAAIREALVSENERLSKVAGDAHTARALANAVERSRKASETLNEAERLLSSVDSTALESFTARLKPIEPALLAHTEARARLEQARAAAQEIDQDFELGLGRTLDEWHQAWQTVSRAEQEEQAAAAALEQALAPLREQATVQLGPLLADALMRAAEARAAKAYWEEQLARGFTSPRLEGEAAATLAAALAERWTKEMNAARNVIELQNERQAYRAAPEVYKTRRLAEVLVNGIKDSRKFFLAFDPGQRLVRVRFSVEQARLSPEEVPAERSR